MAKISMSELYEKLGDVSVSDAEIAKYLTALPGESRPFEPVLTIDRQKVRVGPLEELQVEAAVASNMISAMARMRRRARFEAGLPGNTKPIMYAEGDSWLQFPFIIKDLIDQLDKNYLICCTSKPGDTLQNMVFESPEYETELHELLVRRKLPVRYFMLSGAGNDVVGAKNGRSVLADIVRPYDPSQTAAWHIATDALTETLAFIEKAYRQVLDTVDARFPASKYPELRVVMHGYDYSPTRGVPKSDKKRPFWARDWTGEPLRNLGFPSNEKASEVIAELIDRLNSLTATTAAAYGRAVYCNLRSSVRKDEWADELHPTDKGFKAAAKKLRSFL